MEADIATIIQGGAVGISIALILLIAYIVKNVIALFKNHIQHNTEAQVELIKVITELSTWLRSQNGKGR